MALEASEVAVRVRLVGGSAFQTEASKVAASTEEIGAAAKKTSEATSMSLGSVGTKLTSVGNKMIGFGRTLTMVGVPLAAAGAYAMKTASTFNQQMTLLSTQAGEQAKNIGWMSNAVLDMSKNFGQLPTAMATGLYNFESVGIHGKAALNDIKAAAMGSAVGLDTLANTTDAVSSIITSKIKGAGGPVEAMAIMDRAIGMGKMHLADLTDSFKSGIVPMSQQFGVTFQQLMAAEAALTRVGIPASQVTARMRLMYTSMVAPSTEGAKALADIGIGPTQLASILQGPGGLPAALETLKSKMSLLSGPNQDAILAAVFGRSRGMGQITSMLEQLNQMQSIYGSVMQASPETLERHFQQTKQTSAYKYKALQAQLDAALIKLGDALNRVVLPVLARLVPYLTSVVDWFGKLSHPMQDFVIALGAAVVAGGPLFMFTGAIFKGAGMILSGVSTMVGMEGFMGVLGPIGLFTGALVTAYLTIKPFHNAVNSFVSWIDSILDPHKTYRKSTVRTTDPFTGRHSKADVMWKHFDPSQVLAPGSGGKYQRADINLKKFDGSEVLVKNGDAYSPADALLNPNTDRPVGLSAHIKEAIKEGLQESPVSVYLPNGRILAQTVNEVNRKDQNRR